MKGRVVGEWASSRLNMVPIRNIFFLVLNLAEAFQNFKMLPSSEISFLSKNVLSIYLEHVYFYENSSLKILSTYMKIKYFLFTFNVTFI